MATSLLTSPWLFKRRPAPPTPLTRVLTIGSMASSAKRRAVGLGENPKESEDSSDENPEEEDDSGEEDSEDSEEEINEVKDRSSCVLMPCSASSARLASSLASKLTQLSATR